jgi:hypothetical protein
MSNQPPTMTSSQASDSDSAPQPVHSLPWMKTCPLVEVSACRGFSCGSLPSVISFALEISTEIVRNNDAMTAHSQMTVAAHSEALPPAAFGINIPVAAMRVSGSHPYRMFTRRLFPPASLPVIGVAVIAMVSPHPDMFPAWAGGAMFMDADRRTKFYDDLRMRRTEAQCGSDECVKNDFHCSPATYRQVDGQCGKRGLDDHRFPPASKPHQRPARIQSAASAGPHRYCQRGQGAYRGAISRGIGGRCGSACGEPGGRCREWGEGG